MACTHVVGAGQNLNKTQEHGWLRLLQSVRSSKAPSTMDHADVHSGFACSTMWAICTRQHNHQRSTTTCTAARFIPCDSYSSQSADPYHKRRWVDGGELHQMYFVSLVTSIERRRRQGRNGNAEFSRKENTRLLRPVNTDRYLISWLVR